ncbi:MAG: class IV adenylate cyclase [Candidatus Buchananbacteria bacterium]
MAFDNTEVEIKLALTEEEYFRLTNLLAKITSNQKESKQIDEYFTPANRNFLDPKFPCEWLSLRQRGEKIILNYKHWWPEGQETFTHCDEIEVKVVDYSQTKKALETLGIKSLVTVVKVRLTYNYQNEFEIFLDSVNDLGWFIEIEALKNFGSIQTTRQKLFELAEQLGCDISQPDKRGYPYLLLKKKGLI